MLRDLADELNAASRTRRVVEKRFPEERVRFATAATILETPHESPTGWTLRRFVQRRGNIAITDARIFIQSSFLSPFTLFWLAAIGYGAYQFYWRPDAIGAGLVVAGVLLLIQRRPYSRDLPFTSIRRIQFGSVRGLSGRGDIISIAVERGAIQVVTAQFVPEDVRQRLVAIGTGTQDSR